MSDPLPSIPAIPIGLAMELAALDQRRFNEAVSDGSYKCAPDTRPGQRRFFGEADILGVCLFARLCNDGMHKAEAGRRACDVVEHYRNAERDGDKILIDVVFPSGIINRHGIPRFSDLSGNLLDVAVEEEFVSTRVRVSVLINALRTRFRDFNAAESSASADGDDA